MKKIMVILIVCIIFLTVGIIGIVLYMQDGNIPDETPLEQTGDIVDRTIQEVKQSEIFYRIKRCVDYYVITINEIANQNEEDEYDLYDVYDPDANTYDISQTMLNILGKEYIQEFGISKDNVLDKYQNEQKQSITTILHVYKADNSDNVSTYLAYGMLRDVRTSEVKGISVMVVLDEVNDTFAIYPEEYMQKSGYINMQIGQELTLPEIKAIEINEDNVMKSTYITTEQSLNYCFSAYKELALYNREIAYEFLNKEYREKRFPTFAEYDTYIQNNYVKVMGMSLEKYSKDLSGDSTSYICIDKNDNYYIINEYSAMNFDVQLDIYTLDTTEFLTKYNAGNYQERVVLNLNKVQEALNQGDYRYIYNHLDETFKQNHFPTIDMFNHYMEANYFVSNVFTFDRYQEAGDVASCTVVLTNGENAAESRKQTFIMKLGTGTDFVMSFQL